MIAKAPELALDQKEANVLAAAIVGYAKHHPAVISEEKMALINLAFVLAGIYGTRAAAIAARVRREKRAAKQQSDLMAQTVPGPSGQMPPNVTPIFSGA